MSYNFGEYYCIYTFLTLHCFVYKYTCIIGIHQVNKSLFIENYGTLLSTNVTKPIKPTSLVKNIKDTIDKDVATVQETTEESRQIH